MSETIHNQKLTGAKLKTPASMYLRMKNNVVKDKNLNKVWRDISKSISTKSLFHSNS